MNPFPYPNTISRYMMKTPPVAFALVNGGEAYPEISGIVKFYEVPHQGLIICAEFSHLPSYTPADIPSFHGFHIHEIGNCYDNFTNTGGHYNPNNQPHPYHAGDLPPLMSFNGYSWMCVYVQNLSLNEIMDRSVVVHSRADDFTTQPSGNSGDKIACGIINAWGM